MSLNKLFQRAYQFDVQGLRVISRISNRRTCAPARAACQAASTPASPPPMTITCFIENLKGVTRKTVKDSYDSRSLSPTLRPFHRRNSRRRLELVIGHLAFEMFVVAPLDGFVHIPSAEQQHLYRQVDLGQARQPDALIHTCLLNDESSAGSQRATTRLPS